MRIASRGTTSVARLAGLVLPVAVPALVMLGLGLWGIGRNSTYSAEAVTYWAASLPLPGLWRMVQHVDIFHACYYLLIHAVFEIRRNVVMMRLPSVAGAVGSVLLTFHLTRRLTGRRWLACLAAMLLAVSPGMNEFAQDGRSYALDCMLALGATALLLRAVGPQAVAEGRAALLRAWGPYVVTLAVLGYLHDLTMLLVLTAHAVSLLVTGRRRSLVPWLVSTGVAVLVTSPIIVMTMREKTGFHRHAGRPDLGRGLAMVHMVLGYPTVVVALMVALAVLGASAWSSEPAERDVRRLMVSMLVVPVVVLFVVSELVTPLFIDRYLLFVTPWALMLVALGVHRVCVLTHPRRPALVGAVLGVSVVAVCVGLQVGTQAWLRTPASRGWDLHAYASYLSTHAQPGDGVVYLPRSLDYVGLDYPGQTGDLSNFRECAQPLSAARLRGAPCSPLTARLRLRALRRVWVVYENHHDLRAGLGALALQFHRTVVSHLPGSQIALYVRNPSGSVLG